MKSVLVKSIDGAFEYVMAHCRPACGEASRRSDSYAVISIQDSRAGGFGIRFCGNDFCRGVLTLIFDDIEAESGGAVLFGKEQADLIIDFIHEQRRLADTLLVHCRDGDRRSRAVGAFAVRMTGGDHERFLSQGSANMWVYNTLCDRWIERAIYGQ